jgi:hypothetical protein
VNRPILCLSQFSFESFVEDSDQAFRTPRVIRDKQLCAYDLTSAKECALAGFYMKTGAMTIFAGAKSQPKK